MNETYEHIEDVADAINLLYVLHLITKPDMVNLWYKTLDTFNVSQEHYNNYTQQTGAIK